VTTHTTSTGTGNKGPLTVATTTRSWPGAAALDSVRDRMGAERGGCLQTGRSPQVGISELRQWIAELPQRSVLACSGPNAIAAAEAALRRRIGVFLDRPPVGSDAHRLARTRGRATYFAPLRWQLVGTEEFLFEHCRGNVNEVELRYPAEDTESGIAVALHHMVDAVEPLCTAGDVRGRRTILFASHTEAGPEAFTAIRGLRPRTLVRLGALRAEAPGRPARASLTVKAGDCGTVLVLLPTAEDRSAGAVVSRNGGSLPLLEPAQLDQSLVAELCAFAELFMSQTADIGDGSVSALATRLPTLGEMAATARTVEAMRLAVRRWPQPERS
jgi:hypothetical protein